MKSTSSNLIDSSAIGLSGLCLAHCLLLPAMTALLPVFGAWAEAEWVHVVFVLIAAPLAGFSLFRRIATQRPPAEILVLATLGLVLLATAAFGPEAWDIPMTMAGSFSLASAHLWNWRLRSRAHPCAM